VLLDHLGGCGRKILERIAALVLGVLEDTWAKVSRVVSVTVARR
jgi:hypothetical protein